MRKVLDKDAPQFDANQVGVTASRMPTLRSARMSDELTVELSTSEPDAFLPLNLTNLFMASSWLRATTLNTVRRNCCSIAAMGRPSCRMASKACS